ncbi:MAG TPA: ATP-binding protein [Candidatus Saccharimonadales bacterium]|nr:ATP-binding protein [Candidatus Saccharimonadales bacterium]
MLKNLSLRFKLILSFLIIASVLAGVSVYQVKSIQEFDKLFLNLVNKDTQRLAALDEISLMNLRVRDMSFEYHHEVLEGNATQQKAAAESLKRYSAELKKSELRYRELVSDDDKYVTEKDLRQIAKHTDDVIAASAEFVRLTDASRNYTGPESAEIKLTESQADLVEAIEIAIVAEQKGVDTENKKIISVVSEVMSTITWLALATIVLAVMLGLVTATWIARSIARLKAGAQRIANGDFSQPIQIKSHDELGQLGESFNRMSERLRDSYKRIAVEQQRDEAMLQGMSEGLIAIDGKGVVVMINMVATKLLGLSKEEDAIGKQVKDLYELYPADPKHTEALPLDKRPSYITLSTGQETNEVYGFHDPQGNKYLLDISSSPVKLDEKVVGAITVLRDVTKEKEIDRMKTEFISLASHQLRTPLSAIKWFTEMLVSGDAGKLQPEQQEFAENIADSTERMIALVNALLNISRIESGRIMIEPKPTDLRELVGGIVNDLKAKTEEKQQSLIISVHEDLPKINLDARLISQVYLNLLTNAIKYTPKGGEVSVFISKKDDQIISQVTDNGYGIPKEQQGRIFQKFFRAANAVKVETDGTGLGLYLIKAVVESSGGKIWFESEEGKGTTFWFSIPVTGMKAKEGEVTLDI